MKVLHVIPGMDNSAGAERSLAAISPGLIERGVDLHVAILRDRKALVPELEQAGVVVHDLSEAETWVQRYLLVSALVSRVRPDVLHASLWEAAVVCQTVGIRRGVPVLVTWAAVGNAADHTSSRTWRHRVVDVIDRTLAGVCRTHFHAVTEGVATANARKTRTPSYRIHVVERARPDLEPPSAEAVRKCRTALDLAPSARVLLAVGRQEPVKGHVTLVQAMHVLKTPAEEVVLLIAGRDGMGSEPLRSEIRSLNLDNQVHLLGQRDDIDVLLGLADVYVSSSYSEGAAGATIEAFRSRVPVVATDVAGQHGILEHGKNALLAEVKDHVSLAAQIERILDDSKLAERLGTNGRSTFESRFTLDRAVDATVEMYERVSEVGRSRNLRG